MVLRWPVCTLGWMLLLDLELVNLSSVAEPSEPRPASLVDRSRVEFTSGEEQT